MKVRDVKTQVSVEKGTVQVWLEDPQREKILVKVEPGTTGAIQGTARLDNTGDKPSFLVYFEALGEGDGKIAENVHADIQYNRP